jgi:uncharacterized protein YqiB (DUF1249 family)
MENTQTKILSEISTLTRLIEDNYSELQKYLDERRNTLPQVGLNKGELDVKALKNYRDSLKNLIEKYDKKSIKNPEI